jgi:LEA14-like dessication related protein
MRPVTLSLLLAAAPLATACARPEPPTISPERVRVTGLSASTLDLDVELSIANPNGIDLVARTLHARVVIAGQYEVGTVDVPVTTTFAAHQTTKLDVPLSVHVQDLAPLAQLAMTQASLPYAVDGTVGLGGDLLHVDLPFRLTDAVSREQLVRATVGAIPGLRGLR